MRLKITKVSDRYLAVANPSEGVSWESPEPMELYELIDKLEELGFNYRDIQDIITEANDRGIGHM